MAPSNFSDSVTPLAAVINLPRRWQQWAPTASVLHSRQWVNTGRAAIGALKTLADIETLRQDRPGFLKLSLDHARACAQVAANLALKLPKETLSNGEMTLFLARAGIEAPQSFVPARRPLSGELASIVVWFTSAGDFLNLTCLHPSPYRQIVATLEAAMGTRSLAEFHDQARAGELDLLLRCFRDLLARGYSEGLRSVLAHHVPALWEMRRDRPHLSQPWLVVRSDGITTVSIRAVWHALSGDPRQTRQTIQEADDENRRRASGRGRQRKKGP